MLNRRKLLAAASAAVIADTALANDRTTADRDGDVLAVQAPLHIGAVSLAVRDLDAMSRFYETVIGLERLMGTASRVALGAGGAKLIVLEHRPGFELDAITSAGLFHTAFLMPSREHLGRWLAHAALKGVALTGASDHKVSEALYLQDPENNGIEIYADRPRMLWRRSGDEFAMTTEALDLEELVEAGRRHGGPLDHAPSSMRVGHVHLRVGDIGATEAFYGQALGLDLTHRRPGARWFGSGGYHHHIAGNVWSSRGADQRPRDATGLLGFELVARDADVLRQLEARLAGNVAEVRANDGSSALLDPSGITLWPRTRVA